MKHESDGDTTVIGALGIITERLVQELLELEIREQMKTIQPTALLRSARILKTVLETGRD